MCTIPQNLLNSFWSSQALVSNVDWCTAELIFFLFSQLLDFLTTDVPAALTAEEAAQVKGRSMQVRKLEVIQIEAIVRGYVTGSAYKEYKKSGTVHGVKLPEGLRECEAIPGGPIYVSAPV